MERDGVVHGLIEPDAPIDFSYRFPRESPEHWENEYSSGYARRPRCASRTTVGIVTNSN